MIKEIPKSDIIIRPMKVYKEWTLDENDIYPIFGTRGANTLIDIDNDDTSHGYNQKVIHASIKSQFYTNPSTASILTEVGLRKSYASTDERVLEVNLDEYLNDVLFKMKTDHQISSKSINLNDIVQSILIRKNYQLIISQQVKHIFQWIIDTSLHLISLVALSKFNNNYKFI